LARLRKEGDADGIPLFGFSNPLRLGKGLLALIGKARPEPKRSTKEEVVHV
jgi:hypothetical protein